MLQSPKSIAESSFFDPAIDGLRGIAILSVVLRHATKCAEQDPSRRFVSGLLLKIGEAGAGGVALFFVLSAMTLMLSTRTRFSTERSPRLAFYVRRAFRILPLWWVFVLISFALREPPREELVPHLLMYFGFIPNMNFTHVGWSLFVEETFYLFFPLIFLALLRFWGAIAFLLVTISLSGRVFSFSPFANLPTGLEFLEGFRVYHYVTFALGVIAFHVAKADPRRFQAIASKVPRGSWDLAALAVMGAYLTTPAHTNLQIAICFTLVLLGMIEGTTTRRILSSRLLRSFGVACYSIYLFHGIFLYLIRYTDWFRELSAPPLSPDFQMLVAFLLSAGVSLAFGLFSFRYFEMPCVRLGKRIVRRLGLSRFPSSAV